jgi:hypothetical protein
MVELICGLGYERLEVGMVLGRRWLERSTYSIVRVVSTRYSSCLGMVGEKLFGRTSRSIQKGVRRADEMTFSLFPLLLYLAKTYNRPKK